MHRKIYNTNKNHFDPVQVESMLKLLQIVIKFQTSNFQVH